MKKRSHGAMRIGRSQNNGGKGAQLNLAGHFRVREHAFISRLSDLVPESSKIRDWLESALHYKYIDNRPTAELDNQDETIIAQVVKMIVNPDFGLIQRHNREKRGRYNRVYV